MISFKDNVEVGASKNEVWNFFRNLNEHYSKISKNNISFKCIAGVPNGLGAVYKIRNHFKGKILELRYKIVEIKENERLVLNAEFPHVLLGLRIIYNLEGNDFNTVIYEEIQFGSKLPLVDKIVDSVLKIYLCSSFNAISNDQKERLSGLRKLFYKEPVIA